MGDIDRDPELDRVPPDPAVERVTGKASDSAATRDETGKAAPSPGTSGVGVDESGDGTTGPAG